MRSLLPPVRARIDSALGLQARFARRMPVILLTIAAGLAIWVFELGAVLQGQAQVRNWSSVWVGLDLMEIAGLVLTAVLLKRRSACLSAAAAMTATLFGLDAWFDVLTAAAGSAWYESLVDAFFAEIPMAILLAAIAIAAARSGARRKPRQDDEPASCLGPRSSTTTRGTPTEHLRESPSAN